MKVLNIPEDEQQAIPITSKKVLHFLHLVTFFSCCNGANICTLHFVRFFNLRSFFTSSHMPVSGMQGPWEACKQVQGLLLPQPHAPHSLWLEFWGCSWPPSPWGILEGDSPRSIELLLEKSFEVLLGTVYTVLTWTLKATARSIDLSRALCLKKILCQASSVLIMF